MKKKNIGVRDKIARLFISALIIIFLLYSPHHLILLIISLILLLTAMYEFCPIYYLLRISSRKEKPKIQKRKGQSTKSKHVNK